MKEILFIKLRDYILKNNKDHAIDLQQNGEFIKYLDQKIESVLPLIHRLRKETQLDFIIEDVCMELMTKDLPPSKYSYVKNILKEEFGEYYSSLSSSEISDCEVMNILYICLPVFSALNFSNQDNNFLRYAIIGMIDAYLERFGTKRKKAK